MVSVCLPSDALLQHLPSYLGFSYLGCGVSLHGCSSKVQPLLLTLHEGYLLTAALPDLQCGIAPLGPPVPMQPRLLECGVGLPGHRPWPRWCGCSSPPPPLASGLGAWGSSSRALPLTSDAGQLLSSQPLASGVGCSSWPPMSPCGCLLSGRLLMAVHVCMLSHFSCVQLCMTL